MEYSFFTFKEQKTELTFLKKLFTSNIEPYIINFMVHEKSDFIKLPK